MIDHTASDTPIENLTVGFIATTAPTSRPDTGCDNKSQDTLSLSLYDKFF